MRACGRRSTISGRAFASATFTLPWPTPCTQPAASLRIPAGACEGTTRKGSCWTSGKGKQGLVYRDPAGTSDGVRSVTMGADVLKIVAKPTATPVRRARAQLLVGPRVSSPQQFRFRGMHERGDRRR